MRQVLSRIGFCFAVALVVYYATKATNEGEGWWAVWHVFLAACFVSVAVDHWDRMRRSPNVSLTIKGVDPEKFELVRHDDRTEVDHR